jgi:hypothetical protein
VDIMNIEAINWKLMKMDNKHRRVHYTVLFWYMFPH